MRRMIGTLCGALLTALLTFPAAALAEEGPCRAGRPELEAWGLVRDEGDFVGARALEP